MTSAAVFFMREASSPTVISSGILTTSCAFLAISSWSLRIFSCSSERDLVPKRLACCCFLVLVADLLLAALVILHAVGDQRIDAVVIAVGVDGDGAGVDDAALALALRLRLLGAAAAAFGCCGPLRVLVALIVLRLRRTLDIVLLRARLLILLLRTRLIARRGRGGLICAAGAAGASGCGSRRGRRSFLLCRGSGKDLLDRIDLSSAA